MSTYKVPLTTVLNVENHPNADRLDIVSVYGFRVVAAKGSYKKGDICFYVPIDSILPNNIEETMFGKDSKIKLTKGRVKQIKIRQFYSQGLLMKPDVVGFRLKDLTLEANYAGDLNIIKYEPPAAKYQQSTGPTNRNKPKENPYFRKYNGLDNFKWYNTLFKEGEAVVIQEKIHGSHIRFGMAPTAANNLWRKFLKLIKVLPAHEFVYGSNNVQLQQRKGWKGYYGNDVYGDLCKKYNVEAKLKPGEFVHGELYGDGVQKNYNYGCKNGEHKLVIYDVRVLAEDGKDSRWLTPSEVNTYAKERGFDVVPELYRGPYNEAIARELTLGDSVLVPEQKVREGVVIRGENNETCLLGERKVLKLISEEYLSKDQTDYH